jgi:uncharacterized RDD family membrane protein YckC
VAKLIVNPTSSSRREILLPRTLLSIGRDPSNDLVLPDAMVSRRHAVIELRGSQYFLRDCNSSNGSLVNGDRVSERSLRDGDLVAIGTARLLFREEVEIEDAGAKVVQHPSAPRLQCPQCSADYRKGDAFCRQCGAQLAQSVPAKAICSACGTAVPMPARFCNACGASLGKQPGEKSDEQAGKGLEATKPRPVDEEPEVVAAEDVAGTMPAGDAPSRLEPPKNEAPSEPQDPLPPPIEARTALRGGAVAEPLRLASEPLRVPHRATDFSSKPHLAAVPRTPPPAHLPAPIGRRLAAALIDAAVVVLGQAVLLSPLALYWWSRELPRSPQELTSLPVVLSFGLLAFAQAAAGGYYVYFWGLRGATLGKQMLDLAVETEDGVSPIGAVKAVSRLFGYLLSGASLGVGFLMMATRGGSLHDRIAGTRVVRKDRG